jgi:hypothetical protein
MLQYRYVCSRQKVRKQLSLLFPLREFFLFFFFLIS